MKNELPKKEVVSKEVAIQDLNKWFDALEIPEADRIDFDPEEGEKEDADVMREKAIRAIMSGRLVLNSDDKLEYTLKHPVMGKDNPDKIVLSKLTFKNRYREHELEANMKGVNPKDFLPMTRAYIATITDTSKSILGKLYNVDSGVLQAIYTLFTRGDS